MPKKLKYGLQKEMGGPLKGGPAGKGTRGHRGAVGKAPKKPPKLRGL